MGICPDSTLGKLGTNQSLPFHYMYMYMYVSSWDADKVLCYKELGGTVHIPVFVIPPQKTNKNTFVQI